MAKEQYSKWRKPENLILLQGWKRDGWTDENISKRVGISRKTLGEWKKRFPEIGNALKVGKEQVNYEVENKLLKQARSGNVTAQIFWLKNNRPRKYRDYHKTEEEQRKAIAEAVKAEVEAKLAQLELEQAKAFESSGYQTIIIDDIPKEGGADEKGES